MSTHVEREPSAQLHPARTKLHISVAIEATCLYAEIRNTRNTEGECLRDAKVHVAPHGVGIACEISSVSTVPSLDLMSSLTTPSASKSSTPSKSASRKEERPLPTISSHESVVRSIAACMSVQIVQFVLCAVVWAVIVRRIRGNHLLH